MQVAELDNKLTEETKETQEKPNIRAGKINKPKKREINAPLWLSVSEAAKLGGVQNKTIRRAIQSKAVKFKIIGNRYQVDLESLIVYLHSNKKLKNKLLNNGLGQYVDNYNPIIPNLNE